MIMFGADSLHGVRVSEASGQHSLCLCIDYNRAICLRRFCFRICRFCDDSLCAGAGRLTITAQAAATRCLRRRAESLHGHNIFWPWLRRRWIRCTGTADWSSEMKLTDRYQRIESSCICTCIRNGARELRLLTDMELWDQNRCTGTVKQKPPAFGGTVAAAYWQTPPVPPALDRTSLWTLC